MSTSDDCNDGASKLKYDNDVSEVNDMLKNMSTTEEDNNCNDISTCASCGKEGNDVNNTCNKCNSVMYCNAACKKKHKKKHKKACDKRVAELYDEQLFKKPLPAEDCAICFMRVPSLVTGRIYKSCCGKQICSGCIFAPVYDHEGNLLAETCPFCRMPTPETDEEIMERMKKRIEVGDAQAIYLLAGLYAQGLHGLPPDHTKALELCLRAAELGHAASCHNIGVAYSIGEGVEIDKEKATHYYELAAMGGINKARHNLGVFEERSGNMDRAIKHFMISVASGDAGSLKKIQQLYSNGHATKEDYSTSLRAYQEYLNEVKSVQRDEAAAYSEEYRYY